MNSAHQMTKKLPLIATSTVKLHTSRGEQSANRECYRAKFTPFMTIPYFIK